MRANRATKTDNLAKQAFESPNFSDLGSAKLNLMVDKRKILAIPQKKTKFRARLCKQGLSFHFFFCSNNFLNSIVKVIRLVLFPGCSEFIANTIENLVSEKEERKVKGIVLSAFGSGNAPSDKRLIDALHKATSSGVVIGFHLFQPFSKPFSQPNFILVVTSTCLKGNVQLEHYGAGKQLHDIGLVSAGDMTYESCLFFFFFSFSSFS